jgi:neutral trehalase
MDPEFFWSSTASACESGLDFSSRWYKWGSTMKAKKELGRMLIATNDVLPVDLNVFMASNYWTMARLYGDALGEKKYRLIIKELKIEFFFTIIIS